MGSIRKMRDWTIWTILDRMGRPHGGNIRVEKVRVSHSLVGRNISDRRTSAKARSIGLAGWITSV